MKIIVPMAGMGKRMRPHTLTVPKPLIPVAGKPIVQRLVEDLAKVCGESVEEIAYVVGPSFGAEVENNLKNIAEKLGARASIYYQEEALGTAHAVLCAGPSLSGKVIVAFADTLFKTAFKVDDKQEGVIWVKKIEDPRAFGVVKVNASHVITDFVEKPETFVSDLAIIGIYYFRDGDYLKSELQYLIDHNVRDKGEYQLTNALENMKKKGMKFVPGTVDEWLDCGNKDATVYTNRRLLELDAENNHLVASSVSKENAVIIPPCFIGENVKIQDSVIGPFASIGNHTVIKKSIIRNSIIQNNSTITDAHIDNSMIGNHAEYRGRSGDLSISDYSTMIS